MACVYVCARARARVCGKVESCRSCPQRDLGGVQLIPVLLVRLLLVNPRQVESECIYNTSEVVGAAWQHISHSVERKQRVVLRTSRSVCEGSVTAGMLHESWSFQCCWEFLYT